MEVFWRVLKLFNGFELLGILSRNCEWGRGVAAKTKVRGHWDVFKTFLSPKTHTQTSGSTWSSVCSHCFVRASWEIEKFSTHAQRATNHSRKRMILFLEWFVARCALRAIQNFSMSENARTNLWEYVERRTIPVVLPVGTRRRNPELCPWGRRVPPFPPAAWIPLRETL